MKNKKAPSSLKALFIVKFLVFNFHFSYRHTHSLPLPCVKQPSDTGGHCPVHIAEHKFEVLDDPPFKFSVVRLDTTLFLNAIFLIPFFFMVILLLS